jgi:hypothetical protein
MLLEAGLGNLVYSKLNILERAIACGDQKHQFPYLELAIYSTYADLLISGDYSSQIWNPVCTTQFGFNQFRPVPRLWLHELFI